MFCFLGNYLVAHGRRKLQMVSFMCLDGVCARVQRTAKLGCSNTAAQCSVIYPP